MRHADCSCNTRNQVKGFLQFSLAVAALLVWLALPGAALAQHSGGGGGSHGGGGGGSHAGGGSSGGGGSFGGSAHVSSSSSHASSPQSHASSHPAPASPRAPAPAAPASSSASAGSRADSSATSPANAAPSSTVYAGHASWQAPPQPGVRSTVVVAFPNSVRAAGRPGMPGAPRLFSLTEARLANSVQLLAPARLKLPPPPPPSLALRTSSTRSAPAQLCLNPGFGCTFVRQPIVPTQVVFLPIFFGGSPFFGFGSGFGSCWDPWFFMWVPCGGFGGPGFWGPGFGYWNGGYWNSGYWNSGYLYNPPYDSSNSSSSNSTDNGPYSNEVPAVNNNLSQPAASNLTILVFKDGTIYHTSDYWVQDNKLVYRTADGGLATTPIDAIDVQATVDANAKFGRNVVLRPPADQTPPPAPQPNPAPPLDNSSPPQI